MASISSALLGLSGEETAGILVAGNNLPVADIAVTQTDEVPSGAVSLPEGE